MANFQIPAAGISIDHVLDSKSPQYIRLKLSERDTGELIQFLREDGNAKLRTGRHLAVEFGKKKIPVHRAAHKQSQEIFRGSLDGSKPVFFSGKMSHVLEVAQAKEAVAGVDSALEKLKNNLKQSQEAPEAGLASKLLKPGHRPSPLSAGLLNPRPSSPFLNAGFSPRVGPTSAPLLSGQTKEDKIRSEAIKIPVIHLLAMEPQDPSKLAVKLRAKRSEIDPILMKVAKEGKEGKKELRDRAFRELDVWKFPYQTQGDRQLAIDHAIAAFDRQRIDKTDNLWQMLLAKEDRGKGTYLSKLNFDKPLNPGNLTPKIAERSTDGTSTEGRSMNSLASTESSKKGKELAVKPRLTAEQIARNISKNGNREAGKPKSSGVTKDTSNRKNQQTKSDTKIKSAEKVFDSDSDAGVRPLSVKAKRKDPFDVFKPLKLPDSQQRVPQFSAIRDAERGRATPNAMIASRGGRNITEDPKPKPSQVRNDSRPRTGSSPMKPSPLGSSPPTNKFDNETSSNSSKSTALSSAPSSPPATSASSRDRKEYSPVITAGKINNGVKRKADRHEEAPPAKKIQVNGIKAEQKRSNGLPLSLADEVYRRQASKRSPDSDASSVSEKSLTRESVIGDARRFQRYYTKYKELHEKVDRLSEADRKDEDIDTVWNMHKRLSDLKDKIWRDWDTIEKGRA